MMDLTPLDVRKKRGDFARTLRGYDPGEVDGFLELVAERLEEVVRENRSLQERVTTLARQVEGREGRERAVQEALVTAQELREEIRTQAQREAELVRREAAAEVERVLLEGQRAAEELRTSLMELERRRERFLRTYRSMLEKEMGDLDHEEDQGADRIQAVELDLPHSRQRVQEAVEAASSGGGAADAGGGPAGRRAGDPDEDPEGHDSPGGSRGGDPGDGVDGARGPDSSSDEGGRDERRARPGPEAQSAGEREPEVAPESTEDVGPDVGEARRHPEGKEPNRAGSGGPDAELQGDEVDPDGDATAGARSELPEYPSSRRVRERMRSSGSGSVGWTPLYHPDGRRRTDRRPEGSEARGGTEEDEDADRPLGEEMAEPGSSGDPEGGRENLEAAPRETGTGSNRPEDEGRSGFDLDEFRRPGFQRTRPRRGEEERDDLH